LNKCIYIYILRLKSLLYKCIKNTVLRVFFTIPVSCKLSQLTARVHDVLVLLLVFGDRHLLLLLDAATRDKPTCDNGDAVVLKNTVLTARNQCRRRRAVCDNRFPSARKVRLDPDPPAVVRHGTVRASPRRRLEHDAANVTREADRKGTG